MGETANGPSAKWREALKVRNNRFTEYGGSTPPGALSPIRRFADSPFRLLTALLEPLF
jgi:hypothetical protein